MKGLDTGRQNGKSNVHYVPAGFVFMEVRDRLSLIEIRRTTLGLAAGLATGLAVFGIAASGQVVRAPRYESQTVNAPTPQVILPTPAAITPGGTVVEDVIVRVNDQIINRSDLERSQQQLTQELAQSGTSPAEQERRQKDMLRDMIDQQLLISRGKELGINADAEVIRRLDEIRKQNKMDSMEQLETAAKAQGVSFEDFKAQIRNSVITQQVVRDEVGRRLQMSPAQEQAYYDAHKSEFQQAEQVRLSEILVPVAVDATPEAVAQAQAKAADIKAKIAAGGKFDEIAKQFSGGPTAAQGGELGEFKRGALAKVLEDQTFGLKPGESTEPIRTRQGFVILKVTAHQDAGVAPLKDVEQQVQEAMYMGQMQPALRTYLTKLREESYIDLKPGFVDTGASSNETKPVFTAYAPPVAKKKKAAADKKRFQRNGYYAQVTAKKDVVAGPDTTGGRTLTGADAKPLIDPRTGLAVLPAGSGSTAQIRPVVIGKNGKPKKIKREKVRFGQAPRESLSPGPVQIADASATGAATPSTATSSGAIGPPVAPGAVMAADATSSTSQVASVADDPLAPVAPPRAKTRFADRQGTLKQEKAKKVSAKQQEKLSATPVAMTSEEKAAAQTQNAPLGLNGDTGKHKKVKVKKVKRKKGDPKPEKAAKERMQDRAKTEPVAPAQPAPTASPSLAPVGVSDAPSNSAAPVPQKSADQTTLPPVTAPAPGANPTGQPVPGTQPPM